MFAEPLGDLPELVLAVLRHGAQPLLHLGQDLLSLCLRVRVTRHTHLVHTVSLTWGHGAAPGDCSTDYTGTHAHRPQAKHSN